MCQTPCGTRFVLGFYSTPLTHYALICARVFRRWYRCNDDKLAVILRDSPDITIGDSGHYGSPCFQFDGVNVSSKLSSPTPEVSDCASVSHLTR